MRACSIFFLLSILARAAFAQPPDALLQKIWTGVRDAQDKTRNACGRITETRTSSLLAQPKVLRGDFCAEGLGKFILEYKEPERVKLVFNTDYLNVTIGPKTDVLQVGHHVRRTQNYFSRENSLENLEKEFIVEAGQDASGYRLKLTPRSERFSNRINHVIVKLAKADFTLTSLEVDGKNGVRSVFDIVITSRNTKLDPSTFGLYKPAR